MTRAGADELDKFFYIINILWGDNHARRNPKY